MRSRNGYSRRLKKQHHDRPGYASNKEEQIQVSQLAQLISALSLTHRPNPLAVPCLDFAFSLSWL